MADEFITFEGDTWLIAGKGVVNDAGETYCHLSSTTRFRQQRNGKNPVQIGVFLNLSEVAPATAPIVAKKPVPAKVDPTTQLGFLGPMPGFDAAGQWVRAQPIRGRRF
jgi:hypothetical protein